MRELIVLPCVVLLTAAAPSTSAPQGPTTQVAPSDTQQAASASGGGNVTHPAPQEKKICKQLPTTGSRLPNRACLTASEWKQVEEDLDR